MAARADSLNQNSGRREIVDLRTVATHDLEPLLADEIGEWRRDLEWDFEPSAELVRRYAGTNSLGGAALMVDGEVAGYGYAVLEEPRRIIGDVYVRPHLRDANSETQLFRALLSALVVTPRVSRMESQLMLVTQESAAIIARGQRGTPGSVVRAASDVPRWRDSAAAGGRETPGAVSASNAGKITTCTWPATSSRARTKEKRTARSIRSTVHRAARAGFWAISSNFLVAARFIPPRLLWRSIARPEKPAGMVLSSFVASDTGHISQLCVMPDSRGTGLGKELLRESSQCAVSARRAAGEPDGHRVERSTAISIYEKFGFRTIRTFFAYIWEA